MSLKTVLAGAALLAALVAPSHAQTLRWAAQNDILTLDPHSQNHATTNAILMHAYEGLTRYDDKRNVEPALATKWTFITPTQVRFELRKGVKFHDGSNFTADDVIFSFNRIRQPQGTMQIYVTGINEIRKVDDHTVQLNGVSANGELRTMNVSVVVTQEKNALQSNLMPTILAAMAAIALAGLVIARRRRVTTATGEVIDQP